MMKKLFVVLVMLGMSGIAFADTGSVNMTTDNHYQLYLSTSESVLGAFVGQSNQWGSGDGVPPVGPYDWQFSESFTFNLTSGQSYYLQILAVDNGGGYAGVLGDFGLSSANSWFKNGTQSLFTGMDNSNSWKVYKDGFGITQMTLKDLGVNGSGVWGTIAGISGNAHWMWTDEAISGDLVDTTRYFTAKINTVPEPISTALFLLGGATLAVRRIRKSGKK
jgi:hypothetical protein